MILNKRRRPRKKSQTSTELPLSEPAPQKVEIPRVLSPKWPPFKCKEIGRGGEAIIYQLNNKVVAKIFLDAKAHEYKDDKQLQEAAKARIEEMQSKLFDYPVDLPPQLVIPNGVLIDANSKVFGYTMPMVDGVSVEKLTRTDSILTSTLTRNLLTALYDLVVELHQKGVVIGDFNESNVIMSNSLPYLIDSDSMQFGNWQCRSFMPRFADPDILGFIKGEMPVFPEIKKEDYANNHRFCGCRDCKERREIWFAEQKEKREYEIKKAKKNLPWVFTLAKSHSQIGDWYSFLVIAMRLITFTEPYGGVAEGKDLVERIKERITIFSPGVVYPLVAKPLSTVPRPILEVFFKTFQLGERFIPPREIFDSLV